MTGFGLSLMPKPTRGSPSPAQREASRRQGRALLRAARVAWPEAAGLAGLAASVAGDAGAAGGRGGGQG